MREKPKKQSYAFIVSKLLFSILIMVFACSPTKIEQVINDGFGDYVLVPAGSFKMGDNFNEGNTAEKPVHTVYLNDYYIGKYEVTNAEYKKFVSDSGYNNEACWTAGGFSEYGNKPKFWTEPKFRGGGIQGHDIYPVAGVNWFEASAYCKWLSIKTGKTYRLPTEAEWEKAARGTDQRRYPWGDSLAYSYASYHGTNHPYNYESEEGQYYSGIAPVGFFDGTVKLGFTTQNNASPYGAYDMAGNLVEWCSDWYSETYYSDSPSDNPKGPSSGTIRIMRGGGFHDGIPQAGSLRSAERFSIVPPTIQYPMIGFRCVREK